MRELKGSVTSTKREKTITVTVHSYKTHPKYLKKYRVSKKYQVDNPENKTFELDEIVSIYETRPLSKTKRWTIVKPEIK